VIGLCRLASEFVAVQRKQEVAFPTVTYVLVALQEADYAGKKRYNISGVPSQKQLANEIAKRYGTPFKRYLLLRKSG
jgi:hypothetical protein